MHIRSFQTSYVAALWQVFHSAVHQLTQADYNEAQRLAWMRHWMAEGLAAFEAQLEGHPSTGEFCEGELPGLADCCLIPQVYNARRFGVDITAFPAIARIEEACLALPAFELARPELQPDAPEGS